MTEYIFCPQCGTRLDQRKDFPHCPSCNVTYYRNAKPCASILPIRDNRVLLAKRAIEPYKGAYDIIGGFLKEDELPADGALREALEETGARMRVTDLLGMYIDRYGENGDYTLNIHYVGELLDGDIRPGDDVASLEWVEIEKPPLNEGFQNIREALRDLQQWFLKRSKSQ